MAAGLLPPDVAAVLLQDELEVVMEGGWGHGPDMAAALVAALRRSRGGADAVDVTRILAGRAADRCDAILSRAGVRCIRRRGHPGPHRAKV